MSPASATPAKPTISTSTETGSSGSRDPGLVPVGKAGTASPPASRFARLKASAAASRTARNRSTGTAHAGLPRRSRGTPLRRRSPFITVSRSPVDSESTRRGLSGAELLEEPLPPVLAVDPEAQSQDDAEGGEDEREDHQGKGRRGALQRIGECGLIRER